MQPNSSDRSPFSSKCAKRVSIYWTFPGFSRNRPRAKTSREKDFTLTRHMKTFFAQMIAICFSTLNTSAAVFSTRGFTENWMNTFCSTMDRAFFPHSFLEREVCERFSFKSNLTWIPLKYRERTACFRCSYVFFVSQEIWERDHLTRDRRVIV